MTRVAIAVVGFFIGVFLVLTALSNFASSLPLPGHQPPFFLGAGSGNCPDGWNPLDKSSSVTLSGTCNNTASAVSASGEGVRSINAINSGKRFFATTISGTSILSGDTGAGIANSSAVLTTVGVNATNAFMFFDGSGNIFFNGTNTTKTLGARALNDVICHAIDFVNSRGWIRANAGNWNGTVGADPSTNTSGIDISAKFPSTAAFAVGSFNPNVGTAAFILDVSATACGANAPSSGFSAWNFLLRRDLDPAANDNRPMWLEAVA